MVANPSIYFFAYRMFSRFLGRCILVCSRVYAVFRYYVATAQNYNNQLFNKKEAKLNLASLKITISNLYKTNITNDYLYFDYV